MLQKDATKRRNKYYNRQQYSQDERRDNFVTTHNMIFPLGPPVSGPGLLGDRPGAGNTENLIALEHYAAGLKCALTIMAKLKNQKNNYFNVEVVQDSICSMKRKIKKENDDSASSL